MSSTSILVSLDGSARAEAILPHALTLARLTASELVLLRVITPPEQYTDPPTLLPENWYDDERAWSQDYLTTTAQRLKGSVSVRIEILDGDAGGNIISYASSHADVYLVALATRGRGTLGRWILGSVAEQVMHATTSPLLLLHPNEQVGLEAQPISAHLYRRMIVPLDGTALDESALDYVKTLASSSQAAVTLISISPLPDKDDLDDTQHIPRVEEAQRQV
jgi:nucleotide-binding universal stress UspA family protein